MLGVGGLKPGAPPCAGALLPICEAGVPIDPESGLKTTGFFSREWLGLIDEGVRLFKNPWGAPMFGASFFTLTGLHMTHVTVGVVYLGVIAWGFNKRKYTADDVEVSGLYWHFVDLVWMFLFPLIYLMSAKTA